MSELFVVATPIGNLSEFPPRAVETLNACDIIACEDTRQTMKLLSRFDIRSKLVSYHKFNENYRTEDLVSRMKAGDLRVAVVSDAGTPCISDPGYKIVEAARAEGIEVRAVAGPSAMASALSVCGFPISGFTFFGFLPRKKKEAQAIFREIRRSACDVFVFYESPKRVRTFAAMVAQELPQSRVCFCADITKLHEKYYHGRIDAVAAQMDACPDAEKGEYTIVIYTGEAARGGTDAAETQRNGGGTTACGDMTETLRDGANAAQTQRDCIAAVQRDAAETQREGMIAAVREGVLAPEALLVDTMIRYSLSGKEAIIRLAAEDDGLSKNQLYQASIRLKNLLAQMNPNNKGNSGNGGKC